MLPLRRVGYDPSMRLRLGIMTGFAAGYYLGARAGRERYEQMNEWLHKVRRSEPVQTLAEETERMVEQGVEKATSAMHRGDGAGGNGDGTPGPTPDYGAAATMAAGMEPLRPSNVGP
jgi:hypothetical protein